MLVFYHALDFLELDALVEEAKKSLKAWKVCI
jgi:hypothetical protein